MADPIEEEVELVEEVESPEDRAERLQSTLTSCIDSLVVLKELEAYEELTEDQTQFKESNEKYLLIIKDKFPEMDVNIATVFEDPTMFNPEDVMWVPYKRSEDPIIIATVPELPAEEILARKTTEATMKLKASYDKRLSDIHSFIAEGLVSENVLREYEIKERKALESLTSGDYSFFNEAAVSYGMTSEELVDLIIAKATEWRVKEDNGVVRIGTIRSAVEAYITVGDITNANVKLDELNSITVETLVA